MAACGPPLTLCGWPPPCAQDNFGFDLQAVEAAIKKHEAIETDVAAYEDRVQVVVAVAKELEVERYHDVRRILARKDNVVHLWERLLELLKARRQRLEMNLALQRVFQEMLHIMDWMDEMKVCHMLRGPKSEHVRFPLCAEMIVIACGGRPQSNGAWQKMFCTSFFSFASRCVFCLKIMARICWEWRTFCRNMLWWRRTSPSRQTR